MKIEYVLEGSDFLDLMLFQASKSEDIERRKKKGWIILTLSSIILTFYFFKWDNIPMTLYFGAVSILLGAFFPSYFKWKYKRRYTKHINKNFSERFGEKEIFEINEREIFSKDKFGEGTVNLSEVERVDETQKHFFLKVSNGMYLIIPKDKIQEPEILGSEFEKLGIDRIQDLTWEW